MGEATWWSELASRLRWWLAHLVLGIDAREWTLVPIHDSDLPGMWFCEGSPAYAAARAAEDGAVDAVHLAQAVGALEAWLRRDPTLDTIAIGLDEDRLTATIWQYGGGVGAYYATAADFLAALQEPIDATP